MRKKLPLIIGVVLSLVAVYLIKIYTDQQRQVIIEDARKSIERIRTEQVPVLVATQDVPKGSTIDNNSVGVAVIPMQHVQPQAATSLDRIAGMVTLVPISKGEQITLNKLMPVKEAAPVAGTLAMVTPIGKRAITISVDSISGLGGMIRPGDYVDVVAMTVIPVSTAEGNQVTQSAVVPLFQNVLVLAVGQNTGAVPPAAEGRYQTEQPAAAGASPLITLALSPQEANFLAFIQEQGKIRLSLRSPADAEVEPLRPASWDTLLQYLMPSETIEPKEEEKEIEEEPKEYIEIYRGLIKEKIPLSD